MKSLGKIIGSKSVRSKLAAVVPRIWQTRTEVRSESDLQQCFQHDIERNVNQLGHATFRSVYRKLIEPQLILPSVITMEDFCDAAMNCIVVEEANVERAFSDLVRLITSQAAIVQRSRPFCVAAGHFTLVAPDSCQPVVWESENGFRVMLVGTLPRGPAFASLGPRFAETFGWPWQEVYCVIEGACTQNALRRCETGVKRVLKSTFGFLQKLRRREAKRDDQEFAKRPVQLDFTKSSGEAATVESVRAVLDAYFSKPPKEDSVGQRLRNAVHLVVQSGEQELDALSLTLSVSAMEALVCAKDTKNIAETFAKNIASLLESDLSSREAAVRYLKKLYNARSRTIHGELLSHEIEMGVDSRVIANAVICAVTQRRELCRKCGYPFESANEFLAELKSQRGRKNLLDGVEESVVCSLWRKNPTA